MKTVDALTRDERGVAVMKTYQCKCSDCGKPLRKGRRDDLYFIFNGLYDLTIRGGPYCELCWAYRFVKQHPDCGWGQSQINDIIAKQPFPRGFTLK